MYAFKAARSTGFNDAFSKEFRKPGAAMRASAALAGLTILLATAAAAQSPAPPVLNSPYVCANGMTYTVSVCKPWHANDWWCEETEKQNGQVVNTADRSWSSMAGLLQGCTTAPKPADARGIPSALSRCANHLQSAVPERVPHSGPDHGADEGLERAGYRESPVERDACVWSDDCGHGGTARAAKSVDAGRNAHHHQLLQRV